MAKLPPDCRSEHLSRRELEALNRFGALMFPRYRDYPGFDELGCILYIDDMAAFAPEEDLAQLKDFLNLMAGMPGFVLKGVIWATQNGKGWPGPLGKNLRLLDMGLRSIVVSLYYSGFKAPGFKGMTPAEITGFSLNLVKPGPDQPTIPAELRG